MIICRLVASPDALADRLAKRHQDDPEGLAWHLARVGELAQILDQAAFDDLILDSSAIPAAELARSLRRTVGWA